MQDAGAELGARRGLVGKGGGDTESLERAWDRESHRLNVQDMRVLHADPSTLTRRAQCGSGQDEMPSPGTDGRSEPPVTKSTHEPSPQGAAPAASLPSEASPSHCGRSGRGRRAPPDVLPAPAPENRAGPLPAPGARVTVLNTGAGSRGLWCCWSRGFGAACYCTRPA